MSNKRFQITTNPMSQSVAFDNKQKKHYIGIDLEDLLNDQQSTIEQLQEENKKLKDWKKRIIEYLSDWFNTTEYLNVLYKINGIREEIGLDIDE